MQYRCQWKIRTLAENHVGVRDKRESFFEHKGVEYRHWDFTVASGAIGNAWIATFESSAGSLIKIHDEFRSKLLNSIPMIALISQCYTDFLSQSYVIHNIDKDYAYFFNIFNSEPVPLEFEEKSLEALEILEDSDVKSEFFSYWNDATNTVGASPKLLLMFSAIEALCKKPNGEIDKEKRISILGRELDNKFFESGNRGLRHRLVHGDYFQKNDFDKNYPLLIHEKVRAYFNTELFKKKLITTGVVYPQRHFDDNVLYLRSFIKRVDGKKEFELKTILEDFDTAHDNFRELYEYARGKSIKSY